MYQYFEVFYAYCSLLGWHSLRQYALVAKSPEHLDSLLFLHQGPQCISSMFGTLSHLDYAVKRHCPYNVKLTQSHYIYHTEIVSQLSQFV